MKAEVSFMNGGRVDGYYYVRIKGTDFVACEDGHPDFPEEFAEGEKNSKRDAQKLAHKMNKQLKEKNNEQSPIASG